MALLCLPVAAGLAVFLAPQICFNESSTFGNVTVYADTPIDPQWNSIVEDAWAILETAEVFDEQGRYGVFLVKGTSYGKIESLFSQLGMAKAYGNSVFINGTVDLQSGWIIGPVLKMSLVRTLAHEMTHCAENMKYGDLAAAMTASWKREGYAEYIAHANDRKNDDYSLAQVVSLWQGKPAKKALWIDLHDGIMLPRPYIRARVLVEYLMDVEGLTCDEVVHLNRTDKQVHDDLKAWLGSSTHVE